MKIKTIVVDFYETDVERIETFLNQVNNDGYELVSVIQVGLLNHFRYFFKREELE